MSKLDTQVLTRYSDNSFNTKVDDDNYDANYGYNTKPTIKSSIGPQSIMINTYHTCMPHDEILPTEPYRYQYQNMATLPKPIINRHN